MTDLFQQTLHSAATQSPALAALAIFCANDLLFVLVALMVFLGALNLRRLTWSLVARVAVSLAVAALLTLLLNHRRTFGRSSLSITPRWPTRRTTTASRATTA